MIHYSKKYKKYLNKNMFGGVLTPSDIIRYTNLINSDLGPNWCYTGSIALDIYCYLCKIQNPYPPNDIDIIYVPVNCLDKPLKIAGLSRDPSVTTDDGLPYYDLPYNHPNKKKILDLICSSEMKYYEANMGGNILKLLSPQKLLETYEDRFEDLNGSDIIISQKIEMLKKIVSCINQANIKHYKKPSKTIAQIPNPDIGRNLFDDFVDDDYNYVRQPNFDQDE